MIFKIIKYLKSFIRKIFLKIIFGNRINIPFELNKSKFSFVGKCVKIIINKNYKLKIGDGTYISDYCKIECSKGNVDIGKNVFINDSCKIVSLINIKIGNDCMLGPNVGIYDHEHGYENNLMPMCIQNYSVKKVNIGNDVWIGTNAVITKGVNIGNRVIVAANSVVVNDLNCNAMYGGVPAKFIKNI